MADERDEYDRQRDLAGRKTTRPAGSSVEAKLASWGDVPGQSDIFDVLDDEPTSD